MGGGGAGGVIERLGLLSVSVLVLTPWLEVMVLDIWLEIRAGTGEESIRAEFGVGGEKAETMADAGGGRTQSARVDRCQMK
jgi:hypothetical protein